MDPYPSNKPFFTRGFSYIWLAYLGFLLLDPLFAPHRHIWLPTIAVIVAFLGIFTIYFRNTNNTVRLWTIAGVFALALITLPWNTGAITFFVYTAALLPFSIRSIRLILICFFIEVASAVTETYLLHINWYGALLASFLLLVIGGGNIFFAEQKRANARLHLKQEEVEALAAVAERERIARDLHDVLGHTLSVIALKAELAGRLLNQPGIGNPHDETGVLQRAAAEIADVERITRTALAEVRETIVGYRARGLAAEIEAARRTLDAAGVTLILDDSGPDDSGPDATGVTLIRDSDAAGVTLVTGSEPTAVASLTPQEETALALALREAVTNIVRHASASTCRLRFVTEQGHRRLMVEDNGQNPQVREGNGLRGMRERIESLGGHLSLECDRGTRLLIDLPLRAESLPL